MLQELIHRALNSPFGITGWTLIVIAVVLFLFRRGSGKIIGVIAVLIVVVMLAHAAVQSTERAAMAAVDRAENAVSNATPDWLKQLWRKIDKHIPSPSDKACDYTGISIACNILKRDKELLDQINADQEEIEAICKDSPEVENRFGDAGKITFCAGNPFKQAYRQIRAIGAGSVLGTADSISSFIVPDPPTLDSDQYTRCLYDKLKPRADVRAASCTYTDPHKWRLCVEFHMQLPHETVGGNAASAPLDSDILACRKQAYNIR
jgi:hypothetical protein